jgi:hypothetical protein
VNAERVLEELAASAFSDIRDVFGTDGRILPLAEIPPQARRAIASYSVRQRTRTRIGPRGKKVVESVEVVAVRLHSKVGALAALVRYLGMFRQRLPSGLGMRLDRPSPIAVPSTRADLSRVLHAFSPVTTSHGCIPTAKAAAERASPRDSEGGSIRDKYKTKK